MSWDEISWNSAKQWFKDKIPTGLSEDQKTPDDPGLVPTNEKTTSTASTELDVSQKVYNYEGLVPVVEVKVTTNYNNESKIINYNKDGLVSGIDGKPEKNQDGTFTDREGHTIMSDEKGEPIKAEDAPEYYSWYKPKITESSFIKTVEQTVNDIIQSNPMSSDIISKGNQVVDKISSWLSDYSPGGIDPESVLSRESLVYADGIADGISKEKKIAYQMQLNDDQNTYIDSLEQRYEDFIKKWQADTEFQQEYSKKKRQERNDPVGDFFDALTIFPAAKVVTTPLRELGIVSKESSKAVHIKAPILKDFATQREVLNTFAGGKAVENTYVEGTKLYRIGDRIGAYWSLKPPPATELQWRMEYAVEGHWNNMSNLYIMEIPKGSSLAGLEGAVGRQSSALFGGAPQLFIDWRAVPESWIQVVPLK